VPGSRLLSLESAGHPNERSEVWFSRVTASELALSEIRIVDSSAMPWDNGLDVVRRMAPEWRANLGAADAVEDAYRRFNTKVLRQDADTGARVELAWCEPGYADITNAYHDTVEECYCLEGAVSLTGEASMRAGTYFWRPPGWVHQAVTPEGFKALLMCEGVSAGDASGPVTRRIRPASEAGTNVLEPDPDRAVGPRGFVHHVESRFLPWIPGGAYARGQDPLEGWDVEHAEFKVLSANPVTGAQSLLVRLAPGFAQAGRHRHAVAQQFFVLEGTLDWGGTALAQGTYVHWPAGTDAAPQNSPEGALLFMKVDGWLGYVPSG
jgi:quercetin dioxygenase-like cupin family protein